MAFKVRLFHGSPDYESLHVAKLTCFPLERRDYKPYSQARVCFAPDGLHLQLLAFEAEPLPESSMMAFFSFAEKVPVSYTHLDVYKRQGFQRRILFYQIVTHLSIGFSFISQHCFGAVSPLLPKHEPPVNSGGLGAIFLQFSAFYAILYEPYYAFCAVFWLFIQEKPCHGGFYHGKNFPFYFGL